MSDNEIIKALECCSKGGLCDDCNFNDGDGSNLIGCTSELAAHALALINQQKAEIERLNNIMDAMVV